MNASYRGSSGVGCLTPSGQSVAGGSSLNDETSENRLVLGIFQNIRAEQALADEVMAAGH